jgi:hypothetical protein
MIESNDKNRKTLSDDALRHAFHSQLPDAPVTDWFCRKVMNRLPEKRRRVANAVEWGAYLLSLCIVGIYWVCWFHRIITNGVATVADFRDVAVIILFTLLPLFAIVAPKISAWLKE